MLVMQQHHPPRRVGEIRAEGQRVLGDRARDVWYHDDDVGLDDRVLVVFVELEQRFLRLFLVVFELPVVLGFGRGALLRFLGLLPLLRRGSSFHHVVRVPLALLSVTSRLSTFGVRSLLGALLALRAIPRLCRIYDRLDCSVVLAGVRVLERVLWHVEDVDRHRDERLYDAQFVGTAELLLASGIIWQRLHVVVLAAALAGLALAGRQGGRRPGFRAERRCTVRRCRSARSLRSLATRHTVATVWHCLVCIRPFAVAAGCLGFHRHRWLLERAGVARNARRGRGSEICKLKLFSSNRYRQVE